MSGDVPCVHLAGGSLAILVNASRVLRSSSLGRVAIIGGLAVLCRLNDAYRATIDLDIALGGISTERLASSLQSGNPGRIEFSSQGLFEIDGIKVDVLETEPIEDEKLDGLSELQQLFIAAHCWALETATIVPVRVGSDPAITELPVATPAALVAMKLHSIQSRRDDRPEKKGSDAEDLYRLLQAFDRNAGLAEAIRKGPDRLGSLVEGATKAVLVDGATRTRRDLLVYGSESGARIDVDLLRIVGQRLIDGIRQPPETR